VLGQDGGEFMTTPLRRVGAGLEGIVVDETLEVVFQGSGDFARATRARAIPQTQGTVQGDRILSCSGEHHQQVVLVETT
jgi:hypothetical protein